MGLIKTAIMAGGGMYAVNKIAKTVERRSNSSSKNSNNNNNNSGQSYSRDNPYPPQGYYRPPPPPFQGASQHHAAWDETDGEYEDQGQPDNYSRREYDPRRDYYPRSGVTGARSVDYSFPTNGDYGGRYLRPSDYPYQPDYTRQPENPPSYLPYPQYIQPPNYMQQQIQRYEEPQRQQSRGPLRDMVTGVAMELVSNNGKGKSGKKNRGSKGSELLSEFFK